MKCRPVTNATLAPGNPLEAGKEYIKVLFVEQADIRMEKGIQDRFSESYPELLELEEDLDVLEKTTTYKSKHRREECHQKAISYPNWRG